jgi:hypothetical protein
MEVPMSREEINVTIKTVFYELYKIIISNFYEETECYNVVPGKKSADIWKIKEKKLIAIHGLVESLLLGESEVPAKLHAIIDETEYSVKGYEIPGTVTRWKRINPKLLYFDPAFELMDELDEETYLEMQRGLAGEKLSLYPDEKLIAERKKYFEEIHRKNEENDLRYSQERIFLNELLNTLKLVFENDFAEYLA